LALAWLILLAAAIAGAASYFYSQRITKVYQSSTTVLVNEAPANQAPNNSTVSLSQELTSTYSNMMTKDNVLTAVSKQLGLTISLGELKNMITVTPFVQYPAHDYNGAIE